MRDRTGRQHDPDRARLVELTHEFGEIPARRRSLAGKRMHGILAPVVNDAAMAGAHQPPHDIAAHPAEPDHPELHQKTPLKSLSRYAGGGGAHAKGAGGWGSSLSAGTLTRLATLGTLSRDAEGGWLCCIR